MAVECSLSLLEKFLPACLPLPFPSRANQLYEIQLLRVQPISVQGKLAGRQKQKRERGGEWDNTKQTSAVCFTS